MVHNPFLKEQSMQIAREHLRRSGEIANDAAADWLLSESLNFLMRQGIRNPLVLSNLAISTYQRVVLSGAVNDEPLERVS